MCAPVTNYQSSPAISAIRSFQLDLTSMLSLSLFVSLSFFLTPSLSLCLCWGWGGWQADCVPRERHSEMGTVLECVGGGGILVCEKERERERQS